MPTYEYVSYEELEEGKVVRIMLNRPDARNAQNRGMLVELDDAFRTAEKDDTVRVVILGGVGMYLGSPSGAPPSTQSSISSISSWVNPRSSLNSAKPFTACHGGMRRESTSSLMALAHGRAAS